MQEANKGNEFINIIENNNQNQKNIESIFILILNHIFKQNKDIINEEKKFKMSLFKEFYNQKHNTLIQSQILLLIRRLFMKVWEVCTYLKNSVFIINKIDQNSFEELERYFKKFIFYSEQLLQNINSNLSISRNNIKETRKNLNGVMMYL